MNIANIQKIVSTGLKSVVLPDRLPYGTHRSRILHNRIVFLDTTGQKLVIWQSNYSRCVDFCSAVLLIFSATSSLSFCTPGTLVAEVFFNHVKQSLEMVRSVHPTKVYTAGFDAMPQRTLWFHSLSGAIVFEHVLQP